MPPLAPSLTLDMVIADFNHLPTLPRVVTELLNDLQREEVDANHVADLIAQDPALTAKVLRIANSPFYGLSHRVATLHDALIVLGLSAIQALVSAAAITTQFEAIRMPHYDQNEFWLHSSGAALCARMLARKRGLNPDSAFIAGLLHDIGRLLLIARFNAYYARVIEYSAENECPSLQAEQAMLGFDHTQVGAALARHWRFPADICSAITWHHRPENQPPRSLAHLVHLADIMAHVVNFAHSKYDRTPHFTTSALTQLGLDTTKFQQLLDEADAQRQAVESLLN